MKKSRHWAVLAAAVLSLCYLISLAVAQGPVSGRSGQPMAGPRVALLDVSYIFNNHVRFKGMIKDMKGDVQRAEKQVMADADPIKKLAERLKEFRVGTPDYKDMETELAKRQANLSVQVSLQKSEFLQREATIYHNVYQEISQATDDYCKRNGIDMVLRFNGDPVDMQQPKSVLAFINKPVVWYDKSLDITPIILRELNRTAINPRAADQRGAPMRPVSPFNNNQPLR